MYSARKVVFERATVGSPSPLASFFLSSLRADQCLLCPYTYYGDVMCDHSVSTIFKLHPLPLGRASDTPLSARPIFIILVGRNCFKNFTIRLR